MADGDVRIGHEKLHALGVRALTAVGVPDEHAWMAADVLVTSDLRGIESHGFARFAEFYVGRTRAGLVNPKPNVRVVEDAPAAATIDGDSGLGFVGGTIGMRHAIEKAQATGVGIVTVRNSTHYGAASPYAMLALSNNMIGISMTTCALLVAPPGGAARTYGPNAMAVAAPSGPGEAPFVLDMATAVVPSGKLEIARRRGQSVPAGWAIDTQGQPIEPDPAPFFQSGLLLPLGGDALHGAWKGFGLGVMIDVLTSALSGGLSSAEVPAPGASHFLGALRIDAFTTLESFHDRMKTMRSVMRAAPRLPEAPPLTFAGEPEQAKEDDYRQHGVPYPPAVLASLRTMCEDLGLEYDLE
jgi:LDH2 family malate/lactate/ureidoglycolate dehydrogenase